MPRQCLMAPVCRTSTIMGLGLYRDYMGFRVITPMMESRMEKKMENESRMSTHIPEKGSYMRDKGKENGSYYIINHNGEACQNSGDRITGLPKKVPLNLGNCHVSWQPLDVCKVESPISLHYSRSSGGRLPRPSCRRHIVVQTQWCCAVQYAGCATQPPPPELTMFLWFSLLFLVEL